MQFVIASQAGQQHLGATLGLQQLGRCDQGLGLGQWAQYCGDGPRQNPSGLLGLGVCSGDRHLRQAVA
ncbi:MAG: hypothetical protein ACKOD9_02615, partial [Rubrivivax sp.]